MNERMTPKKIYIAPVEPPQTRRPPLKEIGIVAWLRNNLFSSLGDTIITIITLSIVGLILYNILGWALFSAQWEVVFLNLRSLNVGSQFPLAQVWRVELAAMIVIFISLLSVGVWGRLGRSMVIIMSVISAAMIFVPMLRNVVERPSVFYYTEPAYEDRQINFVADADQVLTINIVPLTSADDFALSSVSGFIENNNQAIETSFDRFTAAATDINFNQTRDPSGYNLNLAFEIRDSEGEQVFVSDFTQGSTETLSFEWTAPAQGWYTMEALYDAEAPGEVGGAWLKVDNLEIVSSTISSRDRRIANYGPEPTFTCRDCGTNNVRTNMRFEGDRSLMQWISLQLGIFLVEVRAFFFIALIVGAVGYFVGRMARTLTIASIQPQLPAIQRFASIMSRISFALYALIQIFGRYFIPESASAWAYPLSLIVFTFFTLIYIISLIAMEGKQKLSRGVALLWMLAVPVLLSILVGFSGSSVMPTISTANMGGLLLTLLFAAVAIVASFPLGMVFALGRQSELPVIRILSTAFIEVMRGVPLITLLFMGRLILPFFGFGLGDVDLAIRIMVVLTLFTSAYMAEVIRGGLQIVPRGQLEAAQALGLGTYQTMTSIVLPQALRAVIPAMMGQAVSLFKDTSLVYIVGLFELVGTMNQILGDSQTGYLSFPREGYLYVGLVFFVFSYLMADVSRRIERTGSGAIRRETL